MITLHQTFQILQRAILDGLKPRPSMSVADWCCANLEFDEPKNRAPFSLAGREFLREPLQGFADTKTEHLVLVTGSQIGKTGLIMGGSAWMIVNDPTRVFWVMPTQDSVRKFSKTRWQTMLRRSPGTRGYIPSGANRHDMGIYEQILGTSIVDMTWSNSPAALASVPAPVVILDEVDKFNEGEGHKEADAVDLAEQRTKAFSQPKIVKTSTPTLVEGLIWQDLQKTDIRRRFMPCPHCGKGVVLIWSKAYTSFPLEGFEACCAWDKEARRADGSWDFARVERSARYECPHCEGHIRESDRHAMDKLGEWRATQSGESRRRGYHLPSLYSPSAQCAPGRLAVKFLEKKNSLLGLQGFINGDLAEPYQAQDTIGERIEIISNRKSDDDEQTGAALLTVDCQAKAPYFWFVARVWEGTESEGIDAGPLDTIEEVRGKQIEHNIADAAVMLDSGFGAKSDAEIYRNCARFCEAVERNDALPLLIGWMPAKGMPSRKTWKDKESGLLLPYYLRGIDPFLGMSEAGQYEMSLFEFAGDYFKDILENMRKGADGWQWKVSADVATDEYWRHMDGEIKVAEFSKRTGRTVHQWKPRSQHWPNHLFDCEVQQVALAASLNLFELPGE